MLVFIDLEWFESKHIPAFPTQLAAVRMDENWQPVDRFASLCRVREESFRRLNHVPFGDFPFKAYCLAEKASFVFENLEAWLRPDDVVYWWHQDGQLQYMKLFRSLCLRETQMHPEIISPNVKSRLRGGMIKKGSPHQIAKARGLLVPMPEHYSANDVETLRILMLSVFESQRAFLDLQHTGNKKASAPRPPSVRTFYVPGKFPYWLEEDKNIVHADSCSSLTPATPAKGCFTLKPAHKAGARFCACCAAIHRKIQHERYRNALRSTQYNFIYSKNSQVFHRYDCICVQNMTSGMPQGAIKYDTCINAGRTPCRLCRPDPLYRRVLHAIPEEAPSSAPCATHNPLAPMESLYRASFTCSLIAAEQRAVSRFFEAYAERSSIVKWKDMTPAEQDNHLTLTQTHYAFWSAQGYNTFHLRKCPKLAHLSHLKGFVYYHDAIASGLTPCKHCRPTKKHDLPLSVPITSRLRPDETPALIAHRCDACGYPHHIENEQFHITTPVGKWRFPLFARPVSLEHINLTRADEFTPYHQQPRLFFSMTDAFEYIRQHDRDLYKKLHPSTNESDYETT